MLVYPGVRGDGVEHALQGTGHQLVVDVAAVIVAEVALDAHGAVIGIQQGEGLETLMLLLDGTVDYQTIAVQDAPTVLEAEQTSGTKSEPSAKS